MSNRLARLSALGAVLILLFACVPTSENPITLPGAKPDSALFGAWRGTLEEGETIYLHFVPGKEGKLTAILIARGEESSEPRDDGWAAFSLVTAEIADTHYMSALFDYDDGEAVKGDTRGWHLLRYVIDDDGTLRMFQVDEEKLARAVEEKKLAGRVKRDQFSTDVRVTSSSEALVAFLRTANPKTLFDKPFAGVTKID